MSFTIPRIFHLGLHVIFLGRLPQTEGGNDAIGLF